MISIMTHCRTHPNSEIPGKQYIDDAQVDLCSWLQGALVAAWLCYTAPAISRIININIIIIIIAIVVVIIILIVIVIL